MCGLFGSPSILDGFCLPSTKMPLTYFDTSNFTSSTSGFVDRQCGRMYDFLCLLYNSLSSSGLGSTNSPVQPYFNSKYNVFDMASPPLMKKVKIG